MEILKMTALELGSAIKQKKVGVREAAQEYLKSVNEKNNSINAYITVTEDAALKSADVIQKKIDSGEATGLLAGVPMCIKDNMCTTGVRTSAASKILDTFVPPYDATAVDKVKAGGAVILGKVNLDEFAMGGSTETSYYGVTKNPWNLEYVPGGSSGGSAAAVAAEMAAYALGSDTGGSVRQPCAFCGLTGIKPTYGSVSRYGLLAYASSLDQIGPVGKDIKDCAAVLQNISGHDIKDSTSVINDAFDFSDIFGSKYEADDLAEKARGMKIGLPLNYLNAGLDDEIKQNILAVANQFESLGAEIHEFEMPTIEYAVPAYYIIACAEASSNLSRYDGVKYGHRTAEAKDIVDSYYKSRSEGFGTEVRRRIMLGSFVLSSGYFDAYYKKALQVRGIIKKAFNDAFEKYDMLLSPVSPTTAYRIGEKISDPLAMYLADIYTVSINLAGLPAVAMPSGIAANSMPLGFQLIGDTFTEGKLIKAGAAFQAVTDYHKASAEFVQKGGEK